jgi:hypothetical protein
MTKTNKKLVLHPVKVPSDFIPEGEIDSILVLATIAFPILLTDKKLEKALLDLKFIRLTQRIYGKKILTEKDLIDFLNFHAEWIPTLMQMFPKFVMCYDFVTDDKICHHVLEFSDIVEYSVIYEDKYDAKQTEKI